MASFVLTSDPGLNVVVNQEEFQSFHSIDRQIFTRLVVGLGRETSQSTHVMAFILWLEKISKNLRTVKNLLQWTDAMLDDLADEVVLVMRCIEASQFPTDDEFNKDLPLMKFIMRTNAISLKYFHENRLNIISSVTRILNDVCVRAFRDIVQQVLYMKALKEQSFQMAKTYGVMPAGYVPQLVFYAPGGITMVPPPVGMVAPQSGEGSSRSWSGFGNPLQAAYDDLNQQAFNRDLNEVVAMLSHTSLSDEKKEVPVDDRIIFMTFSKGYPLFEAEIREFFSRRYGDIIESLHIQDVVPPDQPLYARLVIRPEAVKMIDHFLETSSKVKLSINGKHVWARKFVYKATNSPEATPPGTS
ncbi:hypothetical protein RJT34_24111 [Clitoria ternatea]|uniref:Uncharacterized protein n=1 Tax=Clitoria ternatea TaxID=43366 RepID=A0AAN9IH66_CLITE